MFDIDGFDPEWLEGAVNIASAHGNRLTELAGRRLTDAWLVWDSSDDSWFADGPVVLDFDGEQIEIAHSKFANLSITWNRINTSRPIRWEFDGTYPLEWRPNPLPGFLPLVGSVLSRASLQRWTGRDVARGMVAVGFEFPAGGLLVSNGLDENQVDFGQFPSDFKSVRTRR